MKHRKAAVAVVAFLVFGGVGASLIRTVDILQRKPGPLQITPKDQFSIDLLSSMGGTDARGDVVNFEKRYADHPKPILLHVLAGGAFMLLAGLQFSKTIRNRYRTFHRWSGRFLLLCIVGINLSALYYGIGMPYAGLSETNVTVLMAFWMVYSAARAYLAIRRRDIQTHRVFMIRTFAVAIGISVARVVSVLLTWMFHGFHNAFGPSLWLGFGLSILGGEVWLRATRSKVAVTSGIPVQAITRALLVLVASGAVILAAGCVGSRRVDRNMALPDQAQNLDKKSEYLKVHMRDGSLFILTQWQAHAGMKGVGVRLNAKRDTVERGTLDVPLDSVVLFETNVLHSNAKTALTVFTVITGVTALLCATSPKSCFGSCPTFFAGGDSHILAEGFSSSIAPALEATDIDKLEIPPTSESTFKLRMTNDAQETHVIRSLRLLTFPFVEGRPVYAAKDGFWRVASGVKPRCRHSGGSCTDAIASIDRREWFSAADSTDLAAREEVHIDFDIPASGKYGLVLTSRQTLLHTYVLYQTLAFMGARAGEYIAALGRGDQRVMAGIYNLGRTLGGIEIGAADREGWLETVLETGPLAIDSHVIPLGDLASGTHSLKLRMSKGHWRIDRISIVPLVERVSPVTVVANEITQNGKPYVGSYPIASLPGDEFYFSFDVTKGSELFLEARGYYLEWMRSEWLKEEDARKADMMLYQPALGLKMLAPEFKKWEPRMEELFWNSRYVRN